MEKQFIGKYEIVSTIGRGSMGVVYKARDPEIGRVVAIKTLRTLFLSDDEQGREALQRFRQESRSAGSLQHPNIITIYEAGKTSNGSPYIVMSFVDGKSLEVILKEQGALDPFATLHYLAQVASAIDYAHALNVIHRDIKPSNILINEQFRPYLVDFGVAKLSDSSLTPAGTVVGTPSYMPPEQIRGEKITGAADLFSLAVVAFECFCGMRPFAGNDFNTVVRNILQKEPVSFEEANCALPPELEAVLLKGLAKDPAERCATATEFINALAKALDIAVDGTGILGGYRPSMKYLPRRPVIAEETIGRANAAAKEGVQVSSGDEVPSPEHLNADNRLEEKHVVAEEEEKPRRVSLRRYLVLVLLFGVFIGGYFFSAPATLERVAKDETVAIPIVTMDKPVVTETPQPVETAVVVDLSTLTAEQLMQADTSKLIAYSRMDNLPRGVLVLLAQELSRRDISQTLPGFEQLSKNPDYLVRVEVAKALKNTAYAGHERVFALLVDLLYDDDVYVRGFAAKALGVFANEKAMRALRERLAQEEQHVVISVINKILNENKPEEPLANASSSVITQ